jgi:hypothetical protein
MLYPALTPLALGDLYTLGIDIYGLHVTPEGVFLFAGTLHRSLYSHLVAVGEAGGRRIGVDYGVPLGEEGPGDEKEVEECPAPAPLTATLGRVTNSIIMRRRASFGFSEYIKDRSPSEGLLTALDDRDSVLGAIGHRD